MGGELDTREVFMNIAKASLAAIAPMSALILSAPAVRAQDDLAAVDPTLAATPAPAPQTVAPDAVLKIVQDKDSSVVVVDTQPAEGFAEGPIPGAINYPWVMQIKHFPIGLPRNKTLIFYGSCPHDTDDTIRQLAEYGYFNVKVMDGGWYKWVALKYPAAGKGDYTSAQSPVAQLAVPSDKTEKPSTR
jgi:rhodanese-related sulfurtransferase